MRRRAYKWPREKRQPGKRFAFSRFDLTPLLNISGFHKAGPETDRLRCVRLSPIISINALDYIVYFNLNYMPVQLAPQSAINAQQRSELCSPMEPNTH
jgi:hypothetical protein